MGNADSALTQEDITYMSEHTGMGKDEVKSYFAKFKKTGDPRKAKLNLEEFSSIMAGCFPKTEVGKHDNFTFTFTYFLA